jgi:uncharacterized cupin superfamily protein
VLSGRPTLGHHDGEDVLDPGDVVCFPEGPTGGQALANHGVAAARVITFFTPAGRPMSTFYPEEGTVLIRVSDHEEFLFRLSDQIDYWDGEPAATQEARTKIQPMHDRDRVCWWWLRQAQPR